MPGAIVVGAGPAGALLAYMLAHRGVSVTLLERQSDFSREFRGEVLMPSGIAAIPDGISTSPRNSREKSVCRSSNVTSTPRRASM